MTTIDGARDHKQFFSEPTTSRTRKLGIAAVLQDTTNIVDKPMSWRASQQARRAFQKHILPCAPRGDPVQGAAKKYRSENQTSAMQDSLPQLGDKAVSTTIVDTMQAYVQRNASHEVQNAIALTIMTTAIS